MTRPLTTRPDQGADFETGAVSKRAGKTWEYKTWEDKTWEDMACSIGDAQSLDERGRRNPTEGRLIF
jgi:hypothetical protein